MHQILAYLGKDFLLEFRRSYAFGGLLVFVLCIVYLIYSGFNQMEGTAWVTIYWISFLFISVHTILKGYAQESSGQFLYYYTLVRPEIMFLGKWLFHCCALIILGMLLFMAMILMTGNPFASPGVFILDILIGAVGISLCFTFVSVIALKSDQSTTLMTILSFPLIIPVFLHLGRIGRSALADTMIPEISSSLTTLGAIYLLIAGLGILLFPYLWRS